jgi:hypothetical protein
MSRPRAFVRPKGVGLALQAPIREYLFASLIDATDEELFEP